MLLVGRKTGRFIPSNMLPMRSPIRSYTLLVMGAPGGGKGTVSKYLVRDFGFAHLSTGDLLRKSVADATPIGREAAQFINAGQFVPDELIINLLREEIARSPTERLLLDGFPRTVNQAETLAQIIPVDAAMNLVIPIATIVERISQVTRDAMRLHRNWPHLRRN